MGVAFIHGERRLARGHGLPLRAWRAAGSEPQHLFITLVTVETQLGHAFGMPGITSRTELPPILADDEQAARA